MIDLLQSITLLMLGLSSILQAMAISELLRNQKATGRSSAQPHAARDSR